MPKEIVLRDGPVKIRASLKDGVAQCRHPWLENKVLRFGVSKMTPAHQIQFQAELQKLLDATPRHEHEVPEGVREEIKNRYLKSFAPTAIDVDLKASPQAPLELAGVQAALAVPMVEELSRDNKRLRDQVESLLRATGMRGDAERNATMEGCWQRFEERFQCRLGSQKQERRNVLRRVKRVVEELGWKTVYGSIEKSDIERAINATKPVSETERSKRSVDIKRFFKFLCRPKAEDGFGFLNNPAQTLEYLSPKVLQRRRRGKGLVIAAADPKELLPKLPLYWRALYATLCYAGLRMAEAAALRWDRINFEKKVIGVLPTADYERLKSELSERPVKPFKELWTYLEELRANKLNDTLVFPRPFQADQSWFLSVLGQPKVNHLSREVKKALRAAGVPSETAREPQRRARRYWETRMRSIGRTDLISIMGGHTEAVGRDHYTDFVRVVEKVTGEDF